MTMTDEYNVAEHTCSPNGFGLCHTHPTCDHVRHALSAAQAEVEQLRATVQLEREESHRRFKRIQLLEQTIFPRDNPVCPDCGEEFPPMLRDYEYRKYVCECGCSFEARRYTVSRKEEYRT